MAPFLLNIFVMIAHAIKKEQGQSYTFKTKRLGNITALAEAIILQSIEDLFDDRYRKDCKVFFFGEGFRTCAEIAKMRTIEQMKLLNLVSKYLTKRLEK